MSDRSATTEGPEETLDRLAGDWRIYQLKRGHRFSTDDLVTAWRAALAVQVSDAVLRVLDLGCGIGSVGLCTLHNLDRRKVPATLIGVEAQHESVALARRTVALNGLDARVSVRQGDLRDPEVLPAGAAFDLITGSPPYIPPGHGLLSPFPQRAAARIELRGSVYDYCAAARRWLAPGGRFCFVMAAADARTEDAPRRAGFVVLERWDYVFREGRAPHIATLLCGRREDTADVSRQEGRLVIRGSDGEWTADYLRFRLETGVAPAGIAAPLERESV
jgi:tRNA1(Val) A37 N6-methylase TrmN6